MDCPHLLQRYQVYSGGYHILDFVIEVSKIEKIVDEYWEVRMETVVEKLVRLHEGLEEPVAIRAEAHRGNLRTDNMARDGIPAFVYDDGDVLPDSTSSALLH